VVDGRMLPFSSLEGGIAVMIVMRRAVFSADGVYLMRPGEREKDIFRITTDDSTQYVSKHEKRSFLVSK